MKDLVYKIEISLNPYPSSDVKKPFLWLVSSFLKDNWCNDGIGWAKTPEEAWEEAYKFYCHYKK